MFVFIAAIDAAHRELHADILKSYVRALQRAVGTDMSRGCVVDRKQGPKTNPASSIMTKRNETTCDPLLI